MVVTTPRDSPRRASTMKQVAALAGVGTKTVSRVVNGEPRVAPETAERVWDAVRALDYHVDMRAGSLRRADGRTRTVGLLVSSVNNPFAGEIHRGVEDVARARGVAVLTASLHEEPEREVRAVEDFIDARNWPALLPQPVDALIDACDRVAAKLAMAQWAREQNMRFITVGAAGGKRAGERVEIADITQVTHDPLIAQLRYRMRRAGGTPAGGRPLGVPCVFSREAVAAPDASCSVDGGDGTLNCHGYGSVVSVTATFGQCAAGWVLERIASSARI